MGYLTCYDILLVKGTDIEFQKFLEDLADKSGYSGIKDGYIYDVKWYDWEKDCYEFSKKYPNLMFMIEGDGENADDFWRCYFQNGKSAYYEKQWPPFNESDMK